MMDSKHGDPRWLVGVLKEAISAFKTEDERLLQDEKADDGTTHGSVGECAITHRLAVHLERILQKHGYPNKETPISVDCEYNRHRGAIKQQVVKDKLRARVEELKDRILKEDPEKEGWYVFSVFPDIIVHERGVDTNNLVAIEVKRASNSPDDELDCIKLHLFTIQHEDYGYRYILGATVIAFDDDKFGERRLEIGRLFIDGQCRYRAKFLENEPATHDFLKTPEWGYLSDEQREG
jgi:hypothetical protein